MAENKTEDLNNNTYLVAGLGNPGIHYRHNRHNIGFMVVDALAGKLEIKVKRIKSKAMIGEGKIGEISIILVKPQTFMNLSGKAIGPLVHFFKVPLQNVIIVHDDLDIPLGTLRIRPKGGTGGQQGMRSILTTLGSQDIPRLRVGIGRPPGRMDPADYVLHDFDPGQIADLNDVLDRAVKALIVFVTEGLDKAMNKFNNDLEKEN
jgi:PTH1 family peptidyl-tRNA hydrolase